MSINNLIKFFAGNALILIPLYFVFIILFVWYIKNKVLQVSKVFESVLNKAEGAARFYNNDLSDINETSNHIKKQQHNILEDIKKINSILAKYKGETMDTKVYKNMSEEIAKHIENSFINFEDIEENKKEVENIKFNTEISNLNNEVSSSSISYIDEEQLKEVSNKIGTNGKTTQIIKNLKEKYLKNKTVDNSVENVDNSEEIEEIRNAVINNDMVNFDKPLILGQLLKEKNKKKNQLKENK